MSQASTLCIGMDVPKEAIAVAYVAQDHGAEVREPSVQRTMCQRRDGQHEERVRALAGQRSLSGLTELGVRFRLARLAPRPHAHRAPFRGPACSINQ